MLTTVQREIGNTRNKRSVTEVNPIKPFNYINFMVLRHFCKLGYDQHKHLSVQHGALTTNNSQINLVTTLLRHWHFFKPDHVARIIRHKILLITLGCYTPTMAINSVHTLEKNPNNTLNGQHGGNHWHKFKFWFKTDNEELGIPD